MRCRWARCGPALAVLLLGGIAFGKAAVSNEDRDFMAASASDGLAEVALGRLAIQRGVDPQVKALGRKMVDDSTKMNGELKHLARSRGVELPTQMNADDHALCDHLARLPREQFDRAYLDAMSARHDDAIRSFETEAGTGRDPDLTRWAMDNVTVLRAHRDLAQEDRQHL